MQKEEPLIVLNENGNAYFYPFVAVQAFYHPPLICTHVGGLYNLEIYIL